MLISFADFLALSAEKQATTLDELRKEHGVGNLVKMWGISTSRLYKLIHELNLSVSKRGRKPKVGKKSLSVTIKNDQEYPAVKPTPPSVATTRLAFSLSAEGDGELLLHRLQPLFAAMSAANLKFKVSIIAEEI